MNGKPNSWLKRAVNNIAAQNFFPKLFQLLKIFLKAHDLKDATIKGTWVSFGYAAYSFLDWKMIAVGFLLVNYLLEIGLGRWEIFLVMWPTNTLLFAGIVLLSDWTKVDFTLAEGGRRVANIILAESKPLGIIIEIIAGIFQVAYTGMAQFHIFFRKRFNSKLVSYTIFIALSGIQMLVWIQIYVAGINIIKFLWQLFKT